MEHNVSPCRIENMSICPALLTSPEPLLLSEQAIYFYVGMMKKCSFYVFVYNLKTR